MTTDNKGLPQDQRDIEAQVRLEIEHVLHTIDGGYAMDMGGERIVATVMRLINPFSAEEHLVIRNCKVAPQTGIYLNARPAPEALGAAKGELSDVEIVDLAMIYAHHTRKFGGELLDSTFHKDGLIAFARAILAKAKGEQS